MYTTLIEVVIRNRESVVNSRNVAETFNKRHGDVIRKIDSIRINWKKMLPELNAKMRPANDEHALRFRDCFMRNDYTGADGRQVKSYDMTRQGFSILTLGFNGKKALAFKIAYTSRFEAMDKELAERTVYHELEKGMRKLLTDTIQAHYTGEHLGRKIQQFTDLLYVATAGNKASKIKQLRGLKASQSVFADGFTGAECGKYMAKQTYLLGLINGGLMDYHELKKKLLEVA